MLFILSLSVSVCLLVYFMKKGRKEGAVRERMTSLPKTIFKRTFLSSHPQKFGEQFC
jgi:hypothetical protein